MVGAQQNHILAQYTIHTRVADSDPGHIHFNFPALYPKTNMSSGSGSNLQFVNLFTLNSNYSVGRVRMENRAGVRNRYRTILVSNG